MYTLVLGVCLGWFSVGAVAQQIPRYPDRPTAPPVFAADNPEGSIFAGVRTEVRHAWKRKVMWRTQSALSAPSQPQVPRANAAEQLAMTRTLDALTAVFKATPTGSVGEGFWINDARQLGFVDLYLAPSGTPAGRWPLQFDTALFPFYHEDLLQGGQWRQSAKGETESIAFRFNRMPGVISQAVIAQEASTGPDRHGIELHLRPRVTDTFFGLPVYEREMLVITRGGRDPWAAVSLGRVLRATLPGFQKDQDTAERRLAKLREDNEQIQAPPWERAERERFEKNNGALRQTRPSNYEARLNSLEHYIRVTRTNAVAAANPQRDAAGAWYWNPVDANQAAQRQFAELTPERAAAPACWVQAAERAGTNGANGIRPSDGRYTLRGDFVAVGTTPACRDVVETNPAYFDLSLPRSTPQIMSFGFGRCMTQLRDGLLVVPTPSRFDAPPQGCHRHRTMWNEADWKAIQALVAG